MGSCRLVKTSRFTYLSFLLFFCLVLSCDPQESISLTFSEEQGLQNHSIDKIEFIDDQNAYALGGNLYQFGIAQTTSDGGLTWTLDTISEKTVRDFDLDSDSVFAAGYRGWYNSADVSENNWQAVRPDDREDIHGIVRQNGITTVVGGIAFQRGFIKRLDHNLRIISNMNIVGEMNAIAKTSDQTLHAVGFGQIHRSLDNGATWIVNEQVGDNYQEVFFISDRIGWIVGQAGSILKTEDNGVSWAELRKPQIHGKENLINIHFRDEDHGVAVGEDGVVFTTIDGGQSWSRVRNLPEYNFTSVYLRDDVAWLGTESGHILRLFL